MSIVIFCGFITSVLIIIYSKINEKNRHEESLFRKSMELNSLLTI